MKVPQGSVYAAQSNLSPGMMTNKQSTLAIPADVAAAVAAGATASTGAAAVAGDVEVPGAAAMAGAAGAVVGAAGAMLPGDGDAAVGART